MFVACDDEAVAAWADAVGARGAVDARARTQRRRRVEQDDDLGQGLRSPRDRPQRPAPGRRPRRARRGRDDLPRARSRRERHERARRCRSRRAIAISYGAGSFDAHLAQALASPATGGPDYASRCAATPVSPSTSTRRTTSPIRPCGRSCPDGCKRSWPADAEPGGRCRRRWRWPTATIDLDVPASALAIGAHPDDIEFGAGGTLAKWADCGCVVHYLVCTDGSKGTWDPDADTAALVGRRRDEQREAARRIAGERAGEVIFLDRVDGELENDAATRTEIVRAIRRLRPDVVRRPRPVEALPPPSRPPRHRAAACATRSSAPATRTSTATSASPRSARPRCCCSRPTCRTTPRT